MQSPAKTIVPADSPLTPPRANPLRSFMDGFALPFRALGVIAKSAQLRKLSIITALISAALLITLAVLLFAYTGSLLGLVWAKPSGWLLALWYPLAVVVFSLLFALSASTVPTIATAPMLDPLSIATEKALGFDVDESGGWSRFLRETVSAIGKMLLRLSVLYIGHALLLILWLLPGLGHAVWSVLAFFWTVFWLSYEYFDIPANRYGMGFGEVFRFVSDNFALALGFGVAVYAILWVPLLNTFFIPVATVGATMGYRGMGRRGRVLAEDV